MNTYGGKRSWNESERRSKCYGAREEVSRRRNGDRKQAESPRTARRRGQPEDEVLQPILIPAAFPLADAEDPLVAARHAERDVAVAQASILREEASGKLPALGLAENLRLYASSELTFGTPLRAANDYDFF